jgi:hypothetical protein
MEVPDLDAVRRLVSSQQRRSSEWEALFRHLCETNGELHTLGQAYIDQLEAELKSAREEIAMLRTELQARPVPLTLRASRALGRFTGR